MASTASTTRWRTGVLLVDGLFCQRPELDGCWDRVAILDAQRIYFASCDPLARADLVIDDR